MQFLNTAQVIYTLKLKQNCGCARTKKLNNTIVFIQETEIFTSSLGILLFVSQLLSKTERITNVKRAKVQHSY